MAAVFIDPHAFTSIDFYEHFHAPGSFSDGRAAVDLSDALGKAACLTSTDAKEVDQAQASLEDFWQQVATSL